MFEARVYEVEHTDQVHIHRVGESLWRQTRGKRTDAGVGDHDVEVPEFGDTLVDCGGHGGPVPNIGYRGESALPLLLDQPRRLVEILRPRQRILIGFDVRAQIHRNDVCALGGQHSRVRAPLTPRSAADHGYLARYPAHLPPFVPVPTPARETQVGVQRRWLPRRFRIAPKAPMKWG